MCIGVFLKFVHIGVKNYIHMNIENTHQTRKLFAFADGLLFDQGENRILRVEIS